MALHFPLSQGALDWPRGVFFYKFRKGSALALAKTFGFHFSEFGRKKEMTVIGDPLEYFKLFHPSSITGQNSEQGEAKTCFSIGSEDNLSPQ